MQFSENMVRNGVIGGLLSIVFFFALYFFNAKLIFHPLYGFIPYLVIFPLFMTLAAIGDRKAAGGYVKFIDAFKSAFVTGAIALLHLVVFTFVLQVIIDPTLEVLAKEAAQEMVIDFMNWLAPDGIPEDQMDEAMAQLEEQDYKPTLGNTIFSYISMASLGAIPAVIIAAFVRRTDKSTPNNSFANQNDQVLDA